jgi:oligosaccharide repeat unit polymerase
VTIGGKNNNSFQRNDATELHLVVRIIITLVVMIGLPFYIRASYQIFLESNKEEFFTGLRNELYEGEKGIGVLKYLTSLSFATFGFNLFSFYRKKGKIENLLLIISLICVLGYTIFATGRVFFLSLLSIFIGIKSMSKTKTPVWHFMAIFFGFILLFILLGAVYGKGANLYSSFAENIPLAIEGVGMYTVAPLNALDLQINTNNFLPSNGDYTLRFFLKIIMEMGFMSQRKIQPLIQDYSFVPYPTNVYTYYQPYIRDFGLLYSLIMLMIFGALHSWVYRKAVRTGSLRFILYFSFLLYPLLMTFFNDVYMVGFSFLFQLLVYVEIILFLNNFFRPYKPPG